MKYVKLLAAAALTLTFAACQSTDDTAIDEAESAADTVEIDDSSSLDEAVNQDEDEDENGGEDVDYGSEDSADTTTDESDAE